MKEKSLIPTPAQRSSVLERRREQKMARSAHAYVRGSTENFYQWLMTPSATILPQGPHIWICGDCHLGNLGPVANADGDIELEIRDLDQTVIGNPAHDLVRLGLSLATSARGSDLPGVTTARMIEQMVGGYQQALAHSSWKTHGRTTESSPIETILKRATRRRWKHLAEERIDDIRPEIPLGERFWDLAEKEKRAIDELFNTEPVRKLITSLKSRKNDSEIVVVDAAYWMKGCSSLGRLRFAVLVRVGKPKDKDGKFCLIDIKEAVPAAAPRSPGTKLYKDHASRVVDGAMNLSPYLGERMLQASLLGHPVVVRELLPQDLKLELDTMTQDEAISVARHLAFVVGKAHARQMDTKTRKKWKDVLDKNQPKDLNAPSWLWKSVVELIVRHERAYLEHCRRYALPAA